MHRLRAARMTVAPTARSAWRSVDRHLDFIDRKIRVEGSAQVEALGRHRQRWTPEQLGELRRLANEKVPVAELAVELGRTAEAIHTRADSEGIKLTKRQYRSSPSRAGARQRSASALERDRRRLMKVLEELKSGELGALQQAEAEELMLAVEQRIESLTREVGNSAAGAC